MYVNKIVETGSGLKKNPTNFTNKLLNMEFLCTETFRTQGKALAKLGIWPCCNLGELELVMTRILLGPLGI